MNKAQQLVCVTGLLGIACLAGGSPGLVAEEPKKRPFPISEIRVEKTGREGQVRLSVKMNPKEVVLPSIVRTGTAPKVQDGVMSREVSLDMNSLQRWIQKYREDLELTNTIVKPIVLGSFPELKAPKKLAVGNLLDDGSLLLPSFPGVPKLSADEEQTVIDRCLMIRDLSVVEDPKRTTKQGVWTFGYLMTQVANEPVTGIKPAVLVERWLSAFQENGEINGFTVPHRRAGIEQLILKDWPRKNGLLDLAEAPFRLLAIGSRLDLRDNVLLSPRRVGKGGAGEARFVFCATKRDGTPLAFTVIFEYAIKKSTRSKKPIFPPSMRGHPSGMRSDTNHLAGHSTISFRPSRISSWGQDLTRKARPIRAL
jgi:hypothetical protein